MSGLTKETLVRLYCDEFWTDAEIGKMFRCSQPKVGHLRGKWGIPTLGKTGRLQCRLPDRLAPTQEQLLIGSLLGDGRLSASSTVAARFNETHCMKQEGYLMWKYKILEPFSESIDSGYEKKSVTGEKLQGKRMSTHSCTVLYPFFDLFYPAPLRRKVFPVDLPDRMTPLVLAVWYMDDGGVTDHGEPRIAFGLDDVSRSRCLSALEKLGLHPIVYGSGGNQAIHFPKQGLEFRHLIEAHVVPEMAYKLPFDLPGRAVRRNARQLTAGVARDLHDRGFSIDAISKIFSVGASTVKRRLQEPMSAPLTLWDILGE